MDHRAVRFKIQRRTQNKIKPGGCPQWTPWKGVQSMLELFSKLFRSIAKSCVLASAFREIFQIAFKSNFVASSGVSVFRRAAQSVSRGQRSEGAAVCKGRGLLSAQITKKLLIQFIRKYFYPPVMYDVHRALQAGILLRCVSSTGRASGS